MPEGDTIHKTATTLRKALTGLRVTRFVTVVEPVIAVTERAPVAGRIVHAVEPRGKHLLIVFRDDAPSAALRRNHLDIDLQRSDLVLHTHLRMTGSWHIYRPDERWHKPPRLARAVLYTDAFVAPCFNAPVVELLTALQADRHPDLIVLGPDAITDHFDADEARERLLRHAHAEIGVALLNQRTMAGVGNVYKSEVLFIRRVSPFARVGELSREAIDGLIAESHRLLQANRNGASRTTVFRLDMRGRLWVYGRADQPCRVCGTLIALRRQGLDARLTYYCPRCQSTG